VGREREKCIIDEKIEKIRNRQKGLLVIESRAGLGKSTLIQYATIQAKKNKVKVFGCCADSIDRDSPYLPWRKFFLSMLGVTNCEDIQFIRRLVSFLFLEKMNNQYEHLCLLNTVFPINLEESNLSRELSPQKRLIQTINMLVDLLQMIVNRGNPILLYIDNCQWLDMASSSLLVEIVKRVEPIFLILTTRPEVKTEEWGKILLEDVTVLKLGPMSETEGRQIFATAINAHHISDQVWKVVATRWNGNPFILSELAITLNTDGVFGKENGNCNLLTSGLNIRIPDSVEGIIISRLDSFSPTAQLVLKVGSVIGHSFSIETLEAIFPIKDGASCLIDCLIKIAESGDILIVDDISEGFKFTHSTVHSVIYNLLLIAQRVELHKAVALYWEKMVNYQELSKWPVIAHHWMTAAQLENPPNHITINKALQYLYKSAELSLDCVAYNEAQSKYTSALQLVQKLPERDLYRKELENNVYFKMACCKQLNGDISGAFELFNKANLSSLSTTCNQKFCFKKRKRNEDSDMMTKQDKES